MASEMDLGKEALINKIVESYVVQKPFLPEPTPEAVKRLKDKAALLELLQCITRGIPQKG